MSLGFVLLVGQIKIWSLFYRPNDYRLTEKITDCRHFILPSRCLFSVFSPHVDPGGGGPNSSFFLERRRVARFLGAECRLAVLCITGWRLWEQRLERRVRIGGRKAAITNGLMVEN